MKILMINPSQSKFPIDADLIRADTYVSIPLATELAKRGHQVDFITSKDSVLDVHQIKAGLNAMFSVMPIDEFYALIDPGFGFEFTKAFYADIYLKCLEVMSTQTYDIIHIHSNYYILELSLLKSIKNTPIAVTLHSLPESKEPFAKFVSTFDLSNTFFLSISHKQQEAFPFKFFGTAFNGVDANQFSFDETGGDTMLFSGRLRKVKGIIDALHTAINTNRKLKFVGKTSTENDFVKSEIDPLIKQNPSLITYLNYIRRSKIQTFYQGGKLTLFPISWEEPFGLVQIESMAVGTPVVAYARGSVPEVIKDGETGFIVNSSDTDIRGDFIIKKTGIEGLCEAVEKIYAMPDEQYRQMRQACRAHVEKNFTVEKMVDGYEKLYEQIIATH